MTILAGWDTDRAVAAGADTTRAKTLEWIWSPLAKHFGSKLAHQISEDDICSYVGARRVDGARGQTIRREVQALRRGLEIARRKGIVLTVPHAPKIKSDPPHSGQRGKLHPPQILSAWLAALPQDARDEATFAALTGLRSAELKRVRFDWIEPAPKGSDVAALLRLPAESTKGRKERAAGLTAPALAIVQSRVAPGRELVFAQQTQRRWYRAACKTIGYDKRIHLRDLRHTFATLALAESGDPWAVMSALGHSDLRTTSRYQSTTDERAAKAAVAASKALLVVTPSLSPATQESLRSRKNGGRRGFRTHDPRLVSLVEPKHPECDRCIYKRIVAEQEAELQQKTWSSCHHLSSPGLAQAKEGAV